jgi:imidazolonepropionase-like amidohydrolase
MKTRLLAVLAALVCFLNAGAAQNAIVIEGAVVIDGIANRPQKNSIIVIDNGRITGFGARSTLIIPPGAKTLRLKGKYVIPGLIDGLVRADSPRDLLQMLAWGVTSASATFLSTKSAIAMERWTAMDTSRAPQIYAAAPVFTAQAGWLADGAADTTVNRMPSTPEEARAQVRKVRGMGLKRIRIIYDAMSWCRDPLPPLARMSKDVLEAILDEASQQKLFTSVQASTLAGARDAATAGAMSLAPGILDEYIDASIVETILTRNDYYVPGFSSVEFLADAEGFMKRVLADKRFRSALSPQAVKEYTSPEFLRRLREQYPNAPYMRSHLQTLRDNLSTLVKNYVLIVMGSNLPEFPGIAAHIELEEMVRSGMSPYQALIAATTFGGQYLGAATKVGTIEIGRLADLVVLDADPGADIRNTRSINMVIKHGRIFNPKELLKAAK